MGIKRLRGDADIFVADLRDALWSRSPFADTWVKRRTNFARTLGVGSEYYLKAPSHSGVFSIQDTDNQALLVISSVLGIGMAVIS